jgi:hypothetical protein
MDFELELWDGKIQESVSTDIALSKLEELEGREKKYLVIRKNFSSSLKIEVYGLNKFHLYKKKLHKTKQSVQPVSKTICKKLVLGFLEGNRNWDKGIRFTDIEPFELKKEMEIPFNKKTLEELKDIERKSFVLLIGSLVASFSAAYYMYFKWNDMSNMDFRIYSLGMGGAIFGLGLFIYTIFDLFEIRKEIKNYKM